ncbi:SagB family peptide dehydrogenase [Clavibacter californiensis]|uniref:SagB/ThcOx family dehydrogenase n=1 Tax=Clavibacter californiensis TaxID=1401995 RepID=A0ABX9N9R4_9MICO|nr:SagB family peptide dehydrogenase [Clavibacter californiensis]RII93041.1 SagB/ThcOx family dehydrogenase [Clavibacter californiensis]UKF79689.1 SagB/ThcOx family dehydrogenase [Clavibacter californiensis]
MIFVDGDQIIWDGYLSHEQFALRTEALKMLLQARTWVTWSELVAAENRSEQHDRETLAQNLIDEGLLVEQDSPLAIAEANLLGWDEWGTSSKHYHFSSRILKKTIFTPPSEDVNRLKAKAMIMQRPPLVSRAANEIMLGTGGDTSQGKISLAEALRKRRTERNFDSSPIELHALSELLDMSARYTSVSETADGGVVAQRSSPSAGCLQSTDIYVICSDVTGLPAGAYAYLPDRHALSPVTATPPPLAKLLPEQTYYQRASAFVVYVGNVSRMQWKYDGPRAYRGLLLDVGHLSQTFYLSCTALNLAVGFSGAVCDEAIEEYLNLNPYEHLVFGITVIGNESPGGAMATRQSLIGSRKPPE